MNEHIKGLCPLCGNFFLHIELRAHILAESPQVRHDTIGEIKARHRNWTDEYGACKGCWEFHRQLSQGPRSAAIPARQH